ncbi:MAG: 50S ribosomal protein L31 [Phycisphaeraceae bacterium]|nr:50S ribosomal protein L31 [Phycisphaeraceae bacterium]
MKNDIHPRYFHNCQVYHNGQVVMTVGATVPELHVEVWSGSHPFFTGKNVFVDSAGRVEKFQKKFATGYFGQKEKAEAERKAAIAAAEKAAAEERAANRAARAAAAAAKPKKAPKPEPKVESKAEAKPADAAAEAKAEGDAPKA